MSWRPDYATSAELKHFARIPDGDGEDTVDDAELGLALTSASRAIDKACNRQFGNVDAVSTARTYTARWSPGWRRYVVEIDDIYNDDVVTVTSSGAALTDFTLEPINAEADGIPYTMLVYGTATGIWSDFYPFNFARNTIIVTSTRWGWAAVPSAIKNATLIQASRFFKRRDSPFGIAGSPDLGNELRLLKQLDPDVAVLVQPYYKF